MVHVEAMGENNFIVKLDLPEGGGCSPCLATKTNGWPYLSWQDFATLARSSEAVWKCFLTTRSVVCGDAQTSWVPQDAVVVNGTVCDAGIDVGGWLWGDFIAHVQATPAQMHLAPDTSKVHPATLMPIEVYWCPQQGRR